MTTGLIDKFAQLFKGYENAHGQHVLNEKPDENGKIKGRASTKRGAAEEQQYKTHLAGGVGGTSLGLIPLLADETCAFGVIDIDIVGVVHLLETVEALEGRVRKLELPLVVCRSKSGGAHLYLFASGSIPAKQMQAKLTEFAATLGYGGAEVFPKQVMRVDEKDTANWVNIAFYGALGKDEHGKPGTARYCIRNGKKIVKLEEFVKYAEMMRISPTALKEVKLKLSEQFSDGPPCLQHLATYGLGEGGRNIALTNIAIYHKMSKPDDWQDAVMKFNYESVQPPLPSSEVTQIIKNVQRKEYFYTCKQPPICNHCDKKLCAKREFGINLGSDSGELFPIDNLTKCVSKDSVRWYAEHQGMRMELTSDQLLSPQMLQKVFMEKFTTIIVTGKQRDWVIKLKELMESCEVVTDPDDASRQGQFENLVDNFFTASRPARNRDELIKGNSFIDAGRIYFRSEDLFNYLSIRRFTNTPHEVWTWLKQMSADSSQMKIKGKMLRVWSIPEPEKFDNSSIALPTEGVEEEL